MHQVMILSRGTIEPVNLWNAPQVNWCFWSTPQLFLSFTAPDTTQTYIKWP